MKYFILYCRAYREALFAHEESKNRHDDEEIADRADGGEPGEAFASEERDNGGDFAEDAGEADAGEEEDAADQAGGVVSGSAARAEQEGDTEEYGGRGQGEREGVMGCVGLATGGFEVFQDVAEFVPGSTEVGRSVVFAETKEERAVVPIKCFLALPTEVVKQGGHVDAGRGVGAGSRHVQHGLADVRCVALDGEVDSMADARPHRRSLDGGDGAGFEIGGIDGHVALGVVSHFCRVVLRCFFDGGFRRGGVELEEGFDVAPVAAVAEFADQFGFEVRALLGGHEGDLGEIVADAVVPFIVIHDHAGGELGAGSIVVHQGRERRGTGAEGVHVGIVRFWERWLQDEKMPRGDREFAGVEGAVAAEKKKLARFLARAGADGPGEQEGRSDGGGGVAVLHLGDLVTGGQLGVEEFSEQSWQAVIVLSIGGREVFESHNAGV